MFGEPDFREFESQVCVGKRRVVSFGRATTHRVHIEADHQTIIRPCFVHDVDARFSSKFQPLFSGHFAERNEREALATARRPIGEHCGVGGGIRTSQELPPRDRPIALARSRFP
jgi:hypothetical protein